jgi:thiol-disulfide isomerase/thioredoxin
MNAPRRLPPLRIFAVLLALLSVTTAMSSTPPVWHKLLGQRPAEWRLEHWLNSKPLTLEQLRGKVVLVRWWTAPDCPFCAATAPALNEFAKDYGQRGLTVVGVYHHKSSTPLRPEDVRARAEKFGFQFPVSIDPDWRTLKKWWLDAGGDDWTSVTFLLDREGRVRHIHPGGQYVKGDAEYEAMKRKIDELLEEKSSPAK